MPPYPITLPAITFSDALNVAFFAGFTMILPPEIPLPTKSFASPSKLNVIPCDKNAPKLCPAQPLKFTLIVSFSKPLSRIF